MNGKQIGAFLTFGAAAFSGGVALGHFLAQKRIQSEIDSELNKIWHSERASKLAEQAMSLYRGGDNATVSEVIQALNPEIGVKNDPIMEELIELTLTTDPEAPIEDDNPGTSIFDEMPGWDYEAELNARAGRSIYIITYDEYFGDEMGYKQGQLTYYRGDDMLCDELNVPIVPYKRLIGNSLNFGHGSKDPTIVFVRNEAEHMEWEINLDEGRYEIEVLGNDAEDVYHKGDLKHSIPRFHLDE